MLFLVADVVFRAAVDTVRTAHAAREGAALELSALGLAAS